MRVLMVLALILISFTLSFSDTGTWNLKKLACVDLIDSSLPASPLAVISPSYDILTVLVNGNTIRLDFLDLRKEERPEIEIVLQTKGKRYDLLAKNDKVFLLPKGTPVGTYKINTDLDYAIVKVTNMSLNTGKIFTVKVYRNGVLMDTTPCTYPHLSPVKVSIVLHGNQPLINHSLFQERFWDPDQEAGLLKPLMIAEKLQIPIEIHMSGFLLANLRWHAPKYLTYIRALQRKGIIDLERGTWSEELLPFLHWNSASTLVY